MVKFTGMQPVLAVSVLSEELDYYRERLGFTISWKWGEPPPDARFVVEQLSGVLSPGGHRLGLRRPQPEDAEQFLELYGTVPVHQIGHAAHALAEERTRIERHLADPHEKHGFGLFVVVDEITEEIVGRTGIKHSLAPEVGDWEIDYMLRRDHRGHGIGRCVAGWTMTQVKQRWSIARVLAHVARDNTPSIRILEAEGFLPMGECEFEDYPEMGVLLRYVWER